MLFLYVASHHKKWNDVLTLINCVYNTNKHETTGYVPFYLNYARSHSAFLDEGTKGREKKEEEERLAAGSKKDRPVYHTLLCHSSVSKHSSSRIRNNIYIQQEVPRRTTNTRRSSIIEHRQNVGSFHDNWFSCYRKKNGGHWDLPNGRCGHGAYRMIWFKRLKSEDVSVWM